MDNNDYIYGNSGIGCGHVVVHWDGREYICRTGLTITVIRNGREVRKTKPCGTRVQINGSYQLVGFCGEEEVYLLNGDSAYSS